MKDERFLCNLPWDHLSVFPHGTCSVCCEAKHNDDAPGHAISRQNGLQKEFSVKTDSIIQIINSDNYKKIRQDMLSGIVPTACEGCNTVEQAGGKSKRLRDSNRTIDYDAVTSPDGSIVPNLATVELRLGNYCNLKCRSCNAESSTSWIQDYYKLKDKVELASGYIHLKNNPITSYDWVDDPAFYDQLLSASQNLRQIMISGGEPFLVPTHFYLLERLIDSGRTNITISYHTNLNYDFIKLKKSLDLLTKFSQVVIHFSIDDVGDRNTYIRANSDWHVMIENLKLFKQHYNFKFYITQTISAYNFFYVEELYCFLQENNLDIPIQVNHVHAPEYLNATILPIGLRQEKLNAIKTKVPEYMWNDLYGRYYNAPDNGLIDTFWRFTNEVDNVRLEMFEITFPEIYELLK
jgi:sulfatase maturation enzyme AslB (radical SAM superfamily)